jgi:hypothetical protein
VRLRRSWFGGVAALVLLPSALLGGPETQMQPARQPAGGHGVPIPPGQPPATTEPGAQDGQQPGAAPGRAEPVPTPVPRAFAVRSPGAERDNGAAG